MAITSLGVYYFFIFDSSIEYNFSDVSFKAHEDSIVLNASASNFTGFNYYNGNTTTVKVCKYDNMEALYKAALEYAFDEIKKYPSEKFNGRIMYVTTANVGENVGDSRYITFVEDNSKNTVVFISAETPEEVDFIANSVKII
ncbi:MAG: hypothetical protein IKV87_06130 [Methanobrevibacter sp.]|nr:hypothetical protein [Methanobrevibacter sp.]